MSTPVHIKRVKPTPGFAFLRNRTEPLPPPPPPSPPTPPSSYMLRQWIAREQKTLAELVSEARRLESAIARQERIRDDLQKLLNDMGAYHPWYNTEMWQMNNKVLPKLRQLNSRRDELPKEKTELALKIERLKAQLKRELAHETKARAERVAAQKAKAAEEAKKAEASTVTQDTNNSSLAPASPLDRKQQPSQAQGKKRKANEMAEKDSIAKGSVGSEPPKKARKIFVRVNESEDDEVLPRKERAINGTNKKRNAPQEGAEIEKPAGKAAERESPRASLSSTTPTGLYGGQPTVQNGKNGSASPGARNPHCAGRTAMTSSSPSRSTENDTDSSSASKPSSGASTPATASSDSSGKSKSKVIGRDRIDLNGKGVARIVRKGTTKKTRNESGDTV